MQNSASTAKDSWAPNIAKITFLLLTAVICGAVIYIIRDFLHSIILGVLFGGMLLPVHNRILAGVEQLSDLIESRRKKPSRRKLSNPDEYELQRISRNRSIAAMLSVILVFFIIVLPLTLLGANIAKQSITAVPSAMQWVEKELPGKLQELDEKYRIQEKLDHIRPFLGIAEAQETEAEDVGQNLEENSGKASDPAGFLVAFIRKAVGFLGKTILAIFSKIWVAVFNFFILLFVMYHVFHDGYRIVGYFYANAPLGQEELHHVGNRIKLVFKAICVSVFGTAIIQALLAMIAFRIVGIPALFWGTILGICSIIPVIGTAIVWVPAAAFLLMSGAVTEAIFLTIFCAGLISNVDNILRPLLMKKTGNTGMSYMVLFFAILGGLQTFGLVGIIYGPLITGICSICLLIFSTQFKSSRHLLPAEENP
ncbi:MAG: AI-2E family transporter [Victivallales bacterium]|nr:AI-2E family transporter [Victivallales bacterium]